MNAIVDENRRITYVGSYALIEDGKVSNFIWLSETNENDFPNAVRVADNLQVSVGDEYRNGTFYHEGKEVVPFYMEMINSVISAYEKGVDSI